MIFKQIFKFLWSGSSVIYKFQRQDIYIGQPQVPAQSTKLYIKHVFELGKEESIHKYASLIRLRVWDNPKFDDSATLYGALIGDVDFSVVNQIFDGDELTLNDPSKEPLGARHTVLNLARMANHAYKRLPSSPWRDMDPGWHVNSTFGWEGTSVRGYVFADAAGENLVIAYKGTTFSIVPGGGDSTGHSDKKSDNLMFSCCCGATNGNWNQVCSCGRENNVCSEKCLISHARENTTYYHGAKLIYDYVREQYKAANITLVGHSLGGALASLVAWETGSPAFTFEAPGERLYAERLGLDLTKKAKILHVGHNADPIFMGTW
ncbi:putative lipase atg15 [Entomophthora muscae]|uniref:Lipase atg15 n=1 Tax=Entomophthora muscae TaxID=34485 RepID=A0ACC2T9Q4_9FUNG|nr:putative lipase atg15 [Entomophthora muscae]